MSPLILSFIGGLAPTAPSVWYSARDAKVQALKCIGLGTTTWYFDSLRAHSESSIMDQWYGIW